MSGSLWNGEETYAVGITPEMIWECIKLNEAAFGYVRPREVCGGNAKQRRFERRRRARVANNG